MTKRWSEIETAIFLSISFTIFLLAFRLLYWGQINFFFYLWNLFLAIIPLVISKFIWRRKKIDLITIVALLGWLLFLPNAPYLITDIIHFYEKPPVPTWFDLLLVTSAAWAG